MNKPNIVTTIFKIFKPMFIEDKSGTNIEIKIGWFRANRCWSVEINGQTIGSSLFTDLGFHNAESALQHCIEHFEQVANGANSPYFFGSAKDEIKALK